MVTSKLKGFKKTHTQATAADALRNAIEGSRTVMVPPTLEGGEDGGAASPSPSEKSSRWSPTRKSFKMGIGEASLRMGRLAMRKARPPSTKEMVDTKNASWA